jgi:hypothetical protein
MKASDYRIESEGPMAGPLLPVPGSTEYLVSDVGMAVVMASKAVTIPFGQEIRVVHVPTGEIVFRKSTASVATFSED